MVAVVIIVQRMSDNEMCLTKTSDTASRFIALYWIVECKISKLPSIPVGIMIRCLIGAIVKSRMIVFTRTLCLTLCCNSVKEQELLMYNMQEQFRGHNSLKLYSL